jgi:hypothetical protein
VWSTPPPTVPRKIGVVIPAYEGNPENERCLRYLKTAAFVEEAHSDNVIRFFVEMGPRVEVTTTPTRPSGPEFEQWQKRDRTIAACRWGGCAKAFDWGADDVIMVDTDVMVPIDFFFAMLNSYKNAEAKTCNVVSTSDGKYRHVDDHQNQLPLDATTCAAAGEIIMLRKSLWERMDKNWQREGRSNEDYEMAEKVRAAGATYYIVPLRCLAD